MPTISFLKNKPAIQVPANTNLMQALTDAGVPVASSCSGEGVCAKCRVHIVQGRSALSPENATEKDLREMNELGPDERISCQVQVTGDVTVDTRYW